MSNIVTLPARKYCIKGCGYYAIMGPTKYNPQACESHSETGYVRSSFPSPCLANDECMNPAWYGLRGDVATRCMKCCDGDVDIYHFKNPICHYPDCKKERNTTKRDYFCEEHALSPLPAWYLDLIKAKGRKYEQKKAQNEQSRLRIMKGLSPVPPKIKKNPSKARGRNNDKQSVPKGTKRISTRTRDRNKTRPITFTQ
jgi:hypothetical protein